MAVTKRLINGDSVWVIDRRFKGANGEERYRRAAQVQSKGAAEAEERRIVDYWTANGTIKPLLVPVAKEPEPDPIEGERWEAAVVHYRRVEMPKKKPSTRHGYELVLKGPGFRRWSGVMLTDITRQAVNEWDTALISTGMSDSTRRNQHIVLRSILKSVGPDGAGLIEELPKFPKLPSVGETPVVAVSADDLQLILSEGQSGKVKYCQMPSVRAAQLAFAVAAYGGVRAGEVRALRRRDVDLVRRVITVRVARSVGRACDGLGGTAQQGRGDDGLTVTIRRSKTDQEGKGPNGGHPVRLRSRHLCGSCHAFLAGHERDYGRRHLLGHSPGQALQEASERA